MTSHHSERSVIRIVIVEDHAVTVDGLVSGLAQESDVTILATAKSMSTGLAACENLHPDVVLLDLHLPDSPGISALIDQFSRQCKHILVFSAESRRAFVEAVLSMNVAGYILKSDSAARIAQALRSVISGLRPVCSAELIKASVRVTPAERQLLRMLARGLKYEQIGARRNTASVTVKKQCERLLVKLELSSREELIAWAAANGYANLEREG